MDEKKVREAIYCMKSFADDAVCEECDNYDRCDHTMVANNARTAIEALEKQLPKKPEEVVGAIYGISYECKNCGSEIEPLDIYADYCKWCGQRLDWTKSYTRFIQDSNKS